MKESSPSFCLLPWVSLAIRNNGDYRVCCHANTSQGGGLLSSNAAVTSLEDARNSELLKQIRRQMLQGEWPQSCVRCLREETAGMRSKRIYSKDTLPSGYTQEWAESVTAPDGELSLEQAPLLDLDVRFGNKCNLACRMCGPSDSSAWISDHQKLGGRFEQTGFDWHESPAFWRSLEARAEEIEHIYIVGGEPLLIERHYQFLDGLIEKGRAGAVTLEYNTNLTVLPQKALDLWKHFKKVRLGVSFDGVGAINDYIRHPSRFHLVEKNLERIDRAEGNYQVWLACTVSVYNLHHLVALMEWVHSKNFKRIGKTRGKEFFVPHPVHRPHYLNIQALPRALKEKYSEFLTKEIAVFLTKESLTENERVSAQGILRRYLEFMKTEDLSAFWPEFGNYTRKLDRIRDQSYRVLEALFDLEEGGHGCHPVG